jgi:hypothetical protein
MNKVSRMRDLIETIEGYGKHKKDGELKVIHVALLVVDLLRDKSDPATEFLNHIKAFWCEGTDTKETKSVLDILKNDIDYNTDSNLTQAVGDLEWLRDNSWDDVTTINRIIFAVMVGLQHLQREDDNKGRVESFICTLLDHARKLL